MLQGLSFVSKSNEQSEIRLIHDSGETTILLFASESPLIDKELYINTIIFCNFTKILLL